MTYLRKLYVYRYAALVRRLRIMTHSRIVPDHPDLDRWLTAKHLPIKTIAERILAAEKVAV